MYSKSRQSIEQICVCRIDEIIKPLTITEGIRKTASQKQTREGVYIDALNGLMSATSKSDLLLLSYIIRRCNMPKGRPTNNPKGESIRIRITDDMRTKLERESFQTGLSISQIIRNLITQKLS